MTTDSDQANDAAPDFASQLGTIAKLAPLIGGLVYIAGFVVVNFSLAFYGLVDFGLLSSSYIAAGLLFAYMVGPSVVWPWLVVRGLYPATALATVAYCPILFFHPSSSFSS